MTAATAALSPEPQRRPGAGGNCRREDQPGRSSAPGNASYPAPGACSRPIRLRGVSAIDTASGEVAGGDARRLREPPRNRLPRLLGAVQR